MIFRLSALVFPSSFAADAVRYSLIVPASLLARGVRLSLAPRVLCQIYRGLNEMAMHSEGPMHASAYYPAHYFYGRQGVYFPWVYGLSEIDDGPTSEDLNGLPSSYHDSIPSASTGTTFQASAGGKSGTSMGTGIDGPSATSSKMGLTVSGVGEGSCGLGSSCRPNSRTGADARGLNLS